MGAMFGRIPIFGDIENRYILKPARISDRRFGKNSNYYFVIEFDIVDHPNEFIDLGNIVKREIFPDRAPFVYNVSFTSSKPSWLTGRSHYADPSSHWFNVFFGFYEFDAP